jgi:uncharacterized damage-inducible protein DinB
MDEASILVRLFSYKAHSNAETIAAIRQFDETSPARMIALAVLNHTYVVDRIFAAHLTGAAHGYASANPGPIPPLEELSEAVRKSDRWYIDYVSHLDKAQLEERIDFTFTDGKPGRMSREEMLMHLTIHGAGHRGQLGLLMMQNSIIPPGDGFTTYLHTAESSTRRRE